MNEALSNRHKSSPRSGCYEISPAIQESVSKLSYELMETTYSNAEDAEAFA